MLGILFSLSVAADEIQHSPTSKELEIPFPWKGNYRCRYFTMGQHESQQLRNPKSHEKF
jgi:putative salt-induced outer membrane protein YdiY